MERKLLKDGKISPAEAVKILSTNGLEVTEDQAKTILEFLQILAKLAIAQYFKK